MVKFLRKEYEYKSENDKTGKIYQGKMVQNSYERNTSQRETLMCKQKYLCKSVNTPMGKIRTGNLMSCNPMQGIRVEK